MRARQWRTVRIVAFWAALLFSYVAAIMPGDESPTLGGSDKTDHVVAFLVLTILACAGWPARPRWTIALGLSLYGIFIELSQAVPFIGRDASVLDWVADSCAIVVGLGLAFVLRRAMPRLFAD